MFLRHPRDRKLLVVQVADHEAHDNKYDRHCGYSDVALEVSRCIDLLPDEQWEPDLEEVCDFVHGCDCDGAFFAVVAADFVGPAYLSCLV